MPPGISKTKWTGNGSAQSHIVPPTSVDFALTYEGKQSEASILRQPQADLRVLWQGGHANNQVYYGDNLPILASLMQASELRRHIRLVYIDPPFATGSVFQSRTQDDAYQDLLSGSHFIEFLRQRLILLRELLAEDGSIYVHLDQNMAFHIKVVMDEIFGRSNFRSWITRKKCNPKNSTRKSYGNISDYILFYTKSDKYVWNRPMQTWTEATAEKEYQYVENDTGRRYKKVPVHAPGTRNGETGKPWRGMLPPPGKHWQYTPETLDAMDARGEIYWSGNGNPRRKIYLDESAGIPYQDIWMDFRDAHNQNIKITGYPSEKNPDMLSLIVNASSNEGDIVLDCFAGSGTTLDVASQLQRRWIGIDNSPAAIAATLTRFAKGVEVMGDFVSQRQTGYSPPEMNLRLFPTKDFTLYCTEQYAGELNSALTSWRNWVE
jgi:adenine-specific DNA-methyltransferase